jgi:hypothetical protein
VINLSDQSLKRLNVTIKTHVPLTVATLKLDVYSALLLLTTTTDVLVTGVTDKPDKLFINLSLVMTTTHVPRILVMHNLDANINQLLSTVTTTTNVLLMDAVLN